MKGRPFGPGNKMGRGRPRGSRNKRTVFMELMQDHGEAMIKQCQVLALKGDPTALRLCMERLLLPCKPSNHPFRMPPLKTMSDIVKAFPILARVVASGKLSAQDGESLSRIFESHRRAIESEDFEKRMVALEQGDGSEE